MYLLVYCFGLLCVNGMLSLYSKLFLDELGKLYEFEIIFFSDYELFVNIRFLIVYFLNYRRRFYRENVFMRDF